MLSHGVFIYLQVKTLLAWLKAQTGEKSFKALTKLFFYGLILVIGSLVSLFLYLNFFGLTRWSGRSMTMLDPTYATKFIPIIASVSEH